ncbi:SAM-dependent methyltransferase [Sciscionella sediminilitoris]|uniref:SAM-dependent methyltransferase n=1 Tax=Sciscionella sediminilitoris TaxID=1445613 RepID=UPI0004DEFEDE|nr:SAM-dependent methyltransferase [Sciscionella sp. SE31]
MADQRDWVPWHINIDEPSAARLYDYLIGGGHNFEADRALAQKFLKAQPNARTIGAMNRAFLRRAVKFLFDQGIRQFLDIGSGIPTVGNVHEVAQELDPECRVVYVDYESVAVAHSRMILEDNDRAGVVQADMNDPETILSAPETRELLDFSQPVGLLMVGVFHFVFPDKDPVNLIRRYREALAPGSWLVISHFTSDLEPEEMAAIVEVMKGSRDPIHPRSKAEIEELFTGFDLVDPGIVATSLWRPDGPLAPGEDPKRAGILAGAGRKRED